MDKNNENKAMSFDDFLMNEIDKELDKLMDELFKLPKTKIKPPIAKPKLPPQKVGDARKDMINHPPHYNFGKFECLEVIEDVLGKEGYAAYLKGNIMKYLWRADKKNGAEDLKKAQFYLDKLIRL